MKRWLLFLTVFAALFVALTLQPVTIARADGGPHGGYSATTDSCAACHRAHTAGAPRLLAFESERGLCLTCHGAAGRGANTDIENGTYHANGGSDVGKANTPDNAPLLGGGLVNYQGKPVTSVHDADNSTTAAWGNGVNRGATANLSAGNLSCSSCHNPHGSANYRLIRTVVNGNPVSVAQVDEGNAKNYAQENWGAGYSSLCSACHSSYLVTSKGSGSNMTLLQTGGTTHRVDMNYKYAGMESGTNQNPETVGYQSYTLPLAQSGPDADTSKNIVTCATCHAAHGTSAQMTGLANSGALPGRTSASDSALLRLDNRGVCQVCHQQGVR
ncbi:MAG: hypothetical protein HY782_28500 [Chloroflexi bacterium]|nr:hypothetical protein [Chloroflexota bacterium]